MRLFTAIELPSEVIANVEQLLNRLRPAADLKWSPAANLHLTTKFIGEWPEDRLDEVKSVLDQLASRPPIPIRVQSLGFFPNPKSPRVFWAGIEAPPDLKALARDTDLALSSLGLTVEPKPYSPHLTLARIKEPQRLDSLHRAITALPSQEFGGFTASSFHLFHSRPVRAGSVYTKLAEFPFSRR